MGGESEAPSAFAWPAGMGNSLLLKFPLTVEFPKFPSNSPLHFPWPPRPPWPPSRLAARRGTAERTAERAAKRTSRGSFLVLILTLILTLFGILELVVGGRYMGQHIPERCW